MELIFEDSIPNLAPVAAFQRFHWGFVHIHQFNSDTGRYVGVTGGGFNGAFPVRALTEEGFSLWSVPEKEWFLVQLLEDAYISINTLYGPHGNPKGKHYTRLNAAWVDCDYGHESNGLSDDEAISTLDSLVERGALPPVSAIELTGRGLRAYWVLIEAKEEWEKRSDDKREFMVKYRHPKPSRPKFAPPKELRGIGPSGKDHETFLEEWHDFSRWPPYALDGNGYWLQDINRALADLIEAKAPELCADRGAVFVTTHQRIAGSINSKSGSRVSYRIRNAPGSATPPTYTLSELSAFCGLGLKKETRPKRFSAPGQAPTYSRNAAKAKSQRRFALLWKELEMLSDARGGFTEGFRNRAALYAVTILRGLGSDEEFLRKKLEEITSACFPALEDWELKSALKGGLGEGKPPRNRTIALDLGVTVEEADRLGLTKLRPDHSYERSSGAAKGRREDRRLKLEALRRQHGQVLPFSLRKLAGLVEGDQSTVRRDLRDLGMATAGQLARG